ncbi:TetR/AcrR family transcriptional regulator [Saccharopolyspora sp. NPDC049357]|uniref:TetR/AcrR family transcriptional regulator n=1 Tax=Saccharopolyspora sp. NPDC049357 TaxID=3154507 RepID=UPI003439D122
MATTRGRPRSFDRSAALDKAVQMFWRRGYEGTSVRDLAEELHIGMPSLYSAFGGKQQLFIEAVDAYDKKYGGFLDRALAEEPTAERAVARVLREAPERYTRRGLPSGCLVVSGDSGTDDPTVTRELRRMRAEKADAFAAKIRSDVAAGILPADTDAAALGRYVMAVLSGIAQAARDGASRESLRGTAEVATRAWP